MLWVLIEKLLISIHNIMFSSRNKKNVSFRGSKSWLDKPILTINYLSMDSNKFHNPAYKYRNVTAEPPP